MTDDPVATIGSIPSIDPAVLRLGIKMPQVEAALAAWAYGNFTEAGEALRKKAATVAALVVKFEDFVGTPLFVRSRTRNRKTGWLFLTPAGRTILPIAHRALGDLGQVCMGVRQTSGGKEGWIDIGCYAPIGNGQLHEALSSAAQWFDPQVRCRVITIEHDQVAVELVSRRIDVAIIRGSPEPFAGRSQPLWSERLLVAIAADHPLAAAATVQGNALTWEQFGGEPFLVSEKGPVAVTQARIDARLRPLGIAPRVEICRSDPGAVLRMVAAGHGICLVPESAINDPCPGIVLREIAGAHGEDCTTYFACWRDDNLHPARKRFLARLFHRLRVGEVAL